MIKLIRKIATNSSVIYVFSNVVEACITFLLLPILTTRLTKTEYGVLSVYLVIVKLIVPVITFNTNVKLSIEYFKVDQTSFSKMLSTLITIPIINSFIFLVLVYTIYERLAGYFDIEYKYMLLLPGYVLLQYFPMILLSIFQSRKEPYKFALYKVSNTLINFLLATLFVVVITAGWFGQIWGFGIGYLLFSILAFSLLVKGGYIKWQFSKKYFKEGLAFGFPLVFHTIAGVIMSMSDRLILKEIKGYEEVALYSVTYQVGTFLTILCTGLTRSIAPSIYEKLNENSKTSLKRLAKEIYVMMGITLFSGILIIFCRDLIYSVLIDEKYYSSKHYFHIVVLGLIFQGFYMYLSNILFFYNKNKSISVLTITMALTNIGLNFLLINKMGTMGAAYATLCTYLLLWLCTWYLSHKASGIQWFKML